MFVFLHCDNVRNCMRSTALACIFAVTLLGHSAYAGDIRAEVAEINKKGLLPMNMVSYGVQQYYKSHARWPTDWREVCEAGIFQSSLHAADGSLIDPDEPRVDRWGDVAYAGPNGTGKAVIRAWILADRGEGTFEIKPPGTYQEQFKKEMPWLPEGEFHPSWFLQDQRWMDLCAITGMLDDCLSEFSSCYYRPPNNLEEFLESPFNPFTASSFNPVTGGLLKLDASAGDIVVENFGTPPGIPPGVNLTSSARLILEDGKPCPYRHIF